ncbi:IclR family transcriptional regulator [Pseudonocardia acaciae]|uniref:IclR family transcriptional regulator n=1 Tax=Pseudonocardia acaciae TaxID=551276 RepID=UPI001470093B|nr:IclR family transcriptional regulator [Pseudonocardia acaciae]
MSNAKLDLASNPDAAPATAGAAKALVKGLALVDLVAAHDGPTRLVDLVADSGLPRPTALRLLEALCRSGVLRTDDAGHYRLGPRVAAWGHAFVNELDLPAMAAEPMAGLVEASGETCFLGVRDEASVVYLVAVNSPQAVRPAARVGSRNPLHCTAIGKVLLAWLPEPEIRGALVAPLERRTANTLADPDAVVAELAAVRERGFATDDVENEDGVRCVAAPIRDHAGAVAAGLSVSAPAYRFSRDDLFRLAPEVLRVAATVSERLGHSATRTDTQATPQ